MRALLATFVLLAACASDAGRPPVARITATPRAIPEHDAFQTDVILDGTASADPVDDPDGLLPLRFSWDISGDEARFQSGDPTSPQPVIRLAGERPATVALTVTDTEDLSTTVRVQLQLTLP